MPTYDYKCNDCSNKFEEFQSMTDDPIASCPKCGKESKRMFSPCAGIIFKGEGFYVNDYKNKKSKPSSESKPQCSNCPSSSGN